MKPKPLSSNMYFKSSLWGGIVISAFFSIFIISRNDLYWCSEISCFSSFLTIFDFPLKILSASLAISGFVALVHRSEQTRHQIEMSINQNLFKNFIDHKKEFMEIISSMESGFPIKISDKSSLYTKLFPNNNTQNVEFISSGRNGDKSDLSFLIENHNKLISQYNDMIHDYSAEVSNPTIEFATWLSEYLILSMKLEIQGEELGFINPVWHGFLSPDVFKGIPLNIENFLYSCERVLVELSRFCFPNKSDEILIKSRVNSRVVQNLINVYCVQDGRKS